MAKKNKLTQEIMDKLRGFSVVTDTVEFIVPVPDLEEEYCPTFILNNITVTDSKTLREKINNINLKLNRKISKLAPKTDKDADGESIVEEISDETIDLIREHKIDAQLEISDMMEEVLRTHISTWSNILNESTRNWLEFEAGEDGICTLEQYSLLNENVRLAIITFLTSLTGGLV
jgi:hypothetical protein